MTARDEAAKAIYRHIVANANVALEAIDAIPDDVLVRLAIERGALKWVDVGVPDDTGQVFVTDGQDFYKELKVDDAVLWLVTP